MPALSAHARRQKLAYLESVLDRRDEILEVGCGDGWLGRELRARGFTRYRGLDLRAPADLVGDIRDWRALGLAERAFDFIVALELVEHVPCWGDLRALLKPGGRLFATSPAPRWDWACAALESAGLCQRRTSAHAHLVDFRAVPRLEPLMIRRVGLVSQWGLFRRPLHER